MSSQSREFHKYFAQLIVAAMVFADFFPAKLFFTKFRKKYFRDISHRFRIIGLNYFWKKCEILQISLPKANKNFRIFSRKLSFAGNPMNWDKHNIYPKHVLFERIKNPLRILKIFKKNIDLFLRVRYVLLKILKVFSKSFDENQ